MFFGQLLKDLRLHKAGMGLRKFADTIKMPPSELSDIEQGYAPPSDDMEWFWAIVYALGLDSDAMMQLQLRRLIEEPFVMQKMPENVLPSVLIHNAEGVPLSVEKRKELAEWLNQRAVEHNKKADEYNFREDGDS